MWSSPTRRRKRPSPSCPTTARASTTARCAPSSRTRPSANHTTAPPPPAAAASSCWARACDYTARETPTFQLRDPNLPTARLQPSNCETPTFQLRDSNLPTARLQPST
eukprot:3884290-Prymnesium_polylepis.1